MDIDVARDFVGVVFHVLLDGAKGCHNHRDGCCFDPHIRSTSISKSLYLLSFSVVLTDVLESRGIDIHSHVNEKRGFILLLL